MKLMSLIIFIFLVFFNFSCNLKVKVDSKGEENTGNKEVKVDLGLAGLNLGVDVKDNDVKINMNGLNIDVKEERVKLDIAGFKLNIDSKDIDLSLNAKNIVDIKNGVNLNKVNEKTEKNDKKTQIIGSGITKRVTRKLKKFTSLNLEGAYAIFIKIGKKQKITLVADDNIIPIIKTKISDKSLSISLDDCISEENTVKIFVSTPSLNKLNIAGSLYAEVKGVKNKIFKLNSAGSSAIDLIGKTDKLKISLAGSSVINSKNLKAKFVSVDIAGSGLVDLFSSKSLKVNINGSGDITYSGNPRTINKIINGVGSVTRVD